MDLNYSDEHNALRDTARRFLKERCTAEARKQPGSLWPAMTELGWTDLAATGGRGLADCMVEVGLIAEAMGRTLCVEPYVSATVLAANLLDLHGTAMQRAQLSSLRLCLAHEEPGHSVDAASVTARAAGDDATFYLTGSKSNVLDAGLADAFLVTARRADGRLSVGIVQRDARGLTVQTFPTVDGRTAARLTLADTPAVQLGAAKDDAAAAIDLVVDQAIAALCADMLGAMDAALEATVAYAKMRVQFGQPIGANQVVKHRLVDMAVRCEEARSITLRALIRAGDGSERGVRARAVSAAKVKVAKAARAVAEEAIQFHGGMGVTDELEVGGYLKRALAFEAVLGTSRWHRARYGALNTTLEAQA